MNPIASNFNDVLLSQALQQAAKPIFIVDRGAALKWANHAYCSMIGVKIGDVLDRMVPSLTPTRDTAEFLMELWTVVLSGQTWMGELTERGPDGSIVHVDAVFTPLTDASGRPTLFLVLEHDVTNRKVEFEKVWHLANHDRLTGLSNRSLFTSTLDLILSQSERNNKKAAVLFIDLDNFKKANDLLGHDAGDWVLVQTAEALRSAVRRSDIVARFGGDEFACILDDVEDIDAAGKVAQKIVDAIAHIKLSHADSGQQICIGASVGISMYPTHGTDPATLRSKADAAMYVAKRDGKNCWRSAA